MVNPEFDIIVKHTWRFKALFWGPKGSGCPLVRESQGFFFSSRSGKSQGKVREFCKMVREIGKSLKVREKPGNLKKKCSNPSKIEHTDMRWWLCQFLDGYYAIQLLLYIYLFSSYFYVENWPKTLFLFFFYFQLSLQLTWLYESWRHGLNRQQEAVKRGKMVRKINFGQRKVSEKSGNFIID